MKLNNSLITASLCVLVLATLLIFVDSRRATALAVREDLCSLRDASTTVVSGTVESIASRWADVERSLMETDVQIRQEAQDGELRRQIFKVTVAGGQIGELGMAVSAEATFSPGEQVIVFLSQRPDGSYGVTERELGKFHVENGVATNAASVTAYDAGDFRRAVSAPAVAGECQISLELKDAAAALAAEARPAVPFSYSYSGAHWYGNNAMDEQFHINVNTLDAGGLNGSVDVFRQTIIQAAETWTAVSNSFFAFRYGGTTGAAATQNDGINAIFWQNMGSTTTLAEATWWYNTSSGLISEADIRFNDYYTWDATGAPSAGEPDLGSVALHELGHWLSLGHDTDSACSSCSVSGPVMCACYPLGRLKRGLQANDIAGVSTIYPQAPVPATAVPTPTATPRPTPTRTPTPTITPRLTRAPANWDHMFVPFMP